MSVSAAVSRALAENVHNSAHGGDRSIGNELSVNEKVLANVETVDSTERATAISESLPERCWTWSSTMRTLYWYIITHSRQCRGW